MELILDDFEILSDYEPGKNILVDKEKFSQYEEDSLITVRFMDSLNTSHQYKMIDETDEYIEMEWFSSEAYNPSIPIRCSSCECIFDAADAEVDAVWDNDGNRYLQYLCPICGEWIVL